MFVVVGLGNPGIAYENTRHNVGFKVVDLLAKEFNVNINKKKFDGLYNELMYNNTKIVLVKPQTYMNLSGECVEKILKFYKLSVQNLIVIYDDIDIDLSKIRIKKNGSAGTHNGMRNIIDCLSNEEFIRIRVGIGRPKNSDIKLNDYVLGKFYFEDEEIINKSINSAKDSVKTIIDEGIEIAMTKFN